MALASTVLLAYLIDIPGQVESSHLTWAAIAAYLLYSLGLYAFPDALHAFSARPWQHWLDLAWYGLLTALTDPATSGIFLFYVFAILVASFRQGSVAGICITFGSAGVYLGVVFMLSRQHAGVEWSALLLRSFFLVSLGIMISLWGGSELSLKKRLALLREINSLSNPRFGVDHVLDATMEKLRLFFEADACVLLAYDTDTERYTLRESNAARPGGIPAPIPAELARSLSPFGSHEAVCFSAIDSLDRGQRRPTRVTDLADGHWTNAPSDLGQGVADILNAGAFMSVPLQAGRDGGRLYLTSNGLRFRDSDASFLAQAVEQAFRLIEHVKILDRMASVAAAVERRRIVTDLHDSAIQPYIGLKMGLEALREQANPANPLTTPIDRLLAMTSSVIKDLRNFVHDIEQQHVASADALASGIQERARRFRDHFGMHVEVEIREPLAVSDRLAAEILQLVNEGLSNVRKHTRASRCRILLASHENMLELRIENPCDAGEPPRFEPRSLTTRTRALGGHVAVDTRDRHSVVHITIPT
ncbi:sensor histidine kinase [Massilia sp. LXY-6]|uniref:sensor histidine kinase n=1 Tax=Massilia sp. LXY-6 TaxID=3379823 RepID=UPI003EE0B9A8